LAAEADSLPIRWVRPELPNQPMGTAQGIRAGRVAWVHDPGVARWDGDTQSGGWYEDRFTDPVRAHEMLRQTLRLVTGAKTDAEAWSNLFRHHNQRRGRGDAGYQPGEKVVVKLNLNCCQRRTHSKQGLYNTPQLTIALLRQLVRHAAVRESDLVVYDASRFVPDSIFDPCHAEFPAIRFEDRDGGEGRFRVLPDLGRAISFADPAAPNLDKTYLPKCLTGATYQINAAVWKGHSLAGVTLCAKNHFVRYIISTGLTTRTSVGVRPPAVTPAPSSRWALQRGWST
jgi:hypothetical protein